MASVINETLMALKAVVASQDAAVRAYAQAEFPDAVAKYDAALAHGNPMVKDWFLMNPLHCLAVCVAYLVIVLVGRVVMSQAKTGFTLKLVSMLHNLNLVFLSGYMAYEIMRLALAHNFSLFCNRVDNSQVELASILWVFYFSKTIEFGDTFIMLLKKNFKQVSFLHVYHHLTIFPIWWVVVYYAPGGEAYFSAFLNSVVHVVMYAYYFCATLKIPFPLKSMITRFQMFQFCCMLTQALYNIFGPCAGNYPTWISWILAVYMLTLLALFYNFYSQAYKAAAADKKKKAQ